MTAFGKDIATKIFQRIQEIKAIDTVENLIRFSIGRCHQLKGKKKGLYAMDLVHPHRLVFKKHNNALEIVIITDIEDYH